MKSPLLNIIVTDNKSYARLIAATFSKVITTTKNKGKIRSWKTSDIQTSSSLRYMESFANIVTIFQGHPTSEIGFSSTTSSGDSNTTTDGLSYFDRLWRTGAGSHAERTIRFVLVFTTSK